jgi:hypothetical protein
MRAFTTDSLLKRVKNVSVHGLLDIIPFQNELMVNATLATEEHLWHHLSL